VNLPTPFPFPRTSSEHPDKASSKTVALGKLPAQEAVAVCVRAPVVSGTSPARQPTRPATDRTERNSCFAPVSFLSFFPRRLGICLAAAAVIPNPGMPSFSPPSSAANIIVQIVELPILRFLFVARVAPPQLLLPGLGAEVAGAYTSMMSLTGTARGFSTARADPL